MPTSIPMPLAVYAYDASAFHNDESGEITAVTEKASPVSADVLVIEDSADSNSKKRVQVGNLPGGGASQLTELSDVTAKTGTGTIVVMAGSPSLTTPTIADFTNSTHDHANAAGGGTLAATVITSGTFADARIAESSVTQHEAALTITESQISDLDHSGGSSSSSGSGAGGTGRVVEIISVDCPANDAPTPGTRDGGSTPAERQAAYEFDAGADTYLDHRCWLSGYTGGGLTFTVAWRADTATSGDVRLGLAIRRLDTGEDFDDAHTFVFNSVDSAAPNAAGKTQYATITFTDGADMDSVVDGEVFVLRVIREGTHGNDDMTGALQLVAILGEES